MYYEKIDESEICIYNLLIKLAAKRGIDVYEVDGPESVSGIYYNYLEEGIKAKVIMISGQDDKENILACLLAYYDVSGGNKGFILAKQKPCKSEYELKAEIIAKRLIALLERWCDKK